MLTEMPSSTNSWFFWAVRRMAELAVFVTAYLILYALVGGDASEYDYYALRVVGSVVLFYVVVTGYWPIQAASFAMLRRRGRRVQVASETGFFLTHSIGVSFLAGIDLFGALTHESRITPIVAGWLAVVAVHAVFIVWRMRSRSLG